MSPLGGCSAEPLTDAHEKRKQMLKLMRAEAAKYGKDLLKMGQVEHMRLQIWAQEQVGIEVTPEQRGFVNG